MDNSITGPKKRGCEVGNARECELSWGGSCAERDDRSGQTQRPSRASHSMERAGGRSKGQMLKRDTVSIRESGKEGKRHTDGAARVFNGQV
jgi:hypothetical protein